MAYRKANLGFIVSLLNVALLSSVLSADRGRWSSNGPLAGWVYQIVIDPSDPSIVYLGSNEGLFKSNDGGRTTTLIAIDHVQPENFHSVTLDPIDSRTVYTTYTGSDGKRKLFKSTDQAESWELVNGDVSVHNIIIDPVETSTFYGIDDSLHKSTDGGLTWKTLKVRVNDDGYLTDFEIDPTNHLRLILSSQKSIYVSQDGGKSWERRYFDSVYWIDELLIDFEDSQIVYVGLRPGSWDTSAVFKSTDGGMNWSPSSQGLPRGTASDLAFDPNDNETLYASIAHHGLYRSADSGTTWVQVASFNYYYTYLSIDPTDAQNIFIGSSFGFWKSTNAGASWESYGTTPVEIHDIVVDPANPAILFAASPGYYHIGGLFKSSNGGEHWENLGVNGRFESLAINPRNSQEIYAGGFFEVDKSLDGGAHWETVLWLMFDHGATAYSLAIDPQFPNRVYAGTVGMDQAGIHKSTDGGENWEWTIIGRDVYQVIINPLHTNVLYAIFYDWGSSGRIIKKSTDWGDFWTPCTTGLKGFRPLSIVLDPMHPETLYTGTAAHGIFKSMDGGESWLPINKYLPDLDSLEVRDISIYASNPNIIYAGTARGVFKSFDGGENWLEINDGLTQRGVLCLTVNDEESPTVSVGTPEGVFTYTDTNAVYEPLAHDIIVYSLIAHDIEVSNRRSMSPKITVGNLGTTSEKDIHITCIIADTTGEKPYFNVQIVQSLSAFDTTTVFFPEWTPQRAGRYSATFYSDLAEDEDTTNNQWEVTIRVLHFTDVAASAGVYDVDFLNNIAWIDFDDDNDLDLLTSKLHQNQGNGTFFDVTTEVGLENASGVRGVGIGDFNNDGTTDMYVGTGLNVEDRLFQNIGGRHFQDVSTSSGIDNVWPAYDIDIIDFDNDGFLDIFVSNVGPLRHNILYRNDGRGAFGDVAHEAGIEMDFGGETAVTGDYDNDGDMDILALNPVISYRNLFYRNNGDGTFSEVSEAIGLHLSGSGKRSGDFGDFDNDGDLDLYVSGLFRNNDNGTFTDVTASAGLKYYGFSEGVFFFDCNNDGHLDLFGSSMTSDSHLFMNQGDGTFVDVSHTLGTPLYEYNWSCAAADYNGDGYVDIALPHILYRNNGGDNNWLHVHLEGIVSNASAIGSRVRVVAGDLSQIREVTGDGGQSLDVEFGLGTASSVDSIIVRWPSSVVQEVTNVAVNQKLTVIETPPVELKGDVNRDNEVNISDLILTVNIILGLVEPTTYQTWAADLNLDGRINILDAVLLIQHILGK